MQKNKNKKQDQFFEFLKKNNIYDIKKNNSTNFYLDSLQFVNVIAFLEKIKVKISIKEYSNKEISNLKYILKKIK